MNRVEIIERLQDTKTRIIDELVDKMLVIRTNKDFDQFAHDLMSYKLKNDEEYEYYNAAYRLLYGEESDAYAEGE